MHQGGGDNVLQFCLRRNRKLPPRLEDLGNLVRVRPQVEHLVVVDNGSSEEQLHLLRGASHELDFTLIENGQNLGIAAALNVGVKWAQTNGSGWVALFDQDSAVTDGFIAQMVADFEHFARQRNILLLIPRYRDPGSCVERVCPLDEDGGPFVTITSGSLLPIGAFEKCGYFKEELFIYTVDDEYSLRLRSRGYSIARSSHAVCCTPPVFPLTTVFLGSNCSRPLTIGRACAITSVETGFGWQ